MAAGVSRNPNSPRQKMINLMYLVFIAMMALNVSSEVLDAFELVENSLRVSTDNASRRNDEVKANLDYAYRENPTKVTEWYEKGVTVKRQTDELYSYIGDLKLRIVQQADGEKGDVENIKQKDNLEAASHVMLAPIVGEGKKLKERIESYRESMSDIVGDPGKKALFESTLSTATPLKGGIIPTSWEVAMFENMPVAAAITLLTKMQNDIRFVEGETLTTLLTNVDIGDYRVNEIKALVIPKSQIVTRGMPYEAQIVLAAIDSTKQPEYYLGETRLSNNIISLPTGAVGNMYLSGKVIADGKTYPYEANYSVTESSATIAPVLMNFLYESIENEVKIAMAGVPSGAIKAELKGGSGTIVHKEGIIWTVKGLDINSSPTVSIVLTADVGGRTITASDELKVRRLPEPRPFLSYKDADGSTRIYRGGTTISRRDLMQIQGVEAAIDDGVLNIPCTVTGFQLLSTDARGNFLPEPSGSGQFTQNQKDYIRNVRPGTRFFIYQVKALDPGQKPIPISYSIEVIVVN